MNAPLAQTNFKTSEATKANNSIQTDIQIIISYNPMSCSVIVQLPLVDRSKWVFTRPMNNHIQN